MNVRKLPSVAFTVALTPALLAVPTVTLPHAAPHPVTPVVQTLPVSGVDAGALASVRGSGMTFGASSKALLTGTANVAGLSGTRPSARALASDDTGKAAAEAAADFSEAAVHGDLARQRPALLTAPRQVRTFSVVGITWASSEALPPAAVSVSVRVRENGVWSDWEVLPGAGDGPTAGTPEAEAAKGRVGTDPLLTAPADGVQVRVDTPTGVAPADVQIGLIDPGTSKADEELDEEPPASSAQAATPQIITRAQWGADESLRGGGSYNSHVRGIVIHHTAGTNNYSSSTAAAQVRGIYVYDTKIKKYSDIAYNFLVDKYGRIYEGRKGSISGPPIRSAGTGGFNVDTMSMSAMGNYDITKPPAALIDGMARVTGWKLHQYGLDPKGRVTLTASQASGTTSRYASGTRVTKDVISPHQAYGFTACPGRYIMEQFSTLKAKAAAYAGQTTPTPTPAPKPTPTPTPKPTPTPTPTPAEPVLLNPSISATSLATTTSRTVFTSKVSGWLRWWGTVTPTCSSTPVASYTGSGSGPITFSWAGTSDQGKAVSPGVYQVHLKTSSRAPKNTTWDGYVEVLPRPGVVAGTCVTTRLTGTDRYTASVVAGRSAFPSGSAVVLASAATDSVVAAPLAYAKAAPLLLTAPGALPQVVADEVSRRKATTAYLVGGPQTVTSTVERQLRSHGVTKIVRLAGRTRYDTAAAVATATGTKDGGVILVADGSPEAYDVAAPAARTGRPILYASSTSVPTETTAALRALRPSAITIAGTAQALPDKSLAWTHARIGRVGGPNRYAASLAIARAFSGLVSPSTVVVASGVDTDLGDIAPAATHGHLTVLIPRTGLPADTKAWLETSGPQRAQVLGQPAVLSTSVLRAVNSAVAVNKATS